MCESHTPRWLALNTQKKKHEHLRYLCANSTYRLGSQSQLSSVLRKWDSHAACPVLPSPFSMGQRPEVPPASVSQPSLVLLSMTCELAFVSLPSLPPQLGVLGHHPNCVPALWHRSHKGSQSTHTRFDFQVWYFMVCSVGCVPQSHRVLDSTSVKTELMFAYWDVRFKLD